MRRRKRGGNERRHIILFFLLVIALGALIASISFLKKPSVPLMPPEAAEMAAKRESDDNGYRLISEALALIPPAPAAATVPDEEYPEMPIRYQPEPDSIGKMLGIGRPDDDEVFVEHIEKCRLVLEKMNEVSDKPYFLWKHGPSYRSLDFSYDAFNRLRTTSVAVMLYDLRCNEDVERAMTTLLNTVRFGKTVSSDGPNYPFSQGLEIEREVLAHIPEIVAALGSDEERMELLDALEGLSEAPNSVRKVFDFELRASDTTDIREDMAGQVHEAFEEVVVTLGSVAQRRTRNFIRKHQATLYQLAEMPYVDYREWCNANPDLSKEYPAFIMFSPFHSLHSIVQTREKRTAYYAAAKLAIHLEMYRLENDAYPETLDALVPDFMAELPMDPFGSEGFKYRIEGDSYLLYSVGTNGKDDGATVKRSRRGWRNPPDIIIYKPKNWQPQRM